ncbi:hypothetical protein [Curtobacterium herbarum]|uniref:Uncharacterized protein n=1 Tax=Curtobacterium herbarum TaxID=150122 RepID=A0ABN1ZGP2_9MICO|nr:hypothetical protein [Curtobacterium herbarum]MBM7474895.1 putative lipid-binding transport protein (Tim44 family) [Curtobacterium herbarum]MCS6545542.1 hypothetical protein [Curtobacterium herbarum]
MPTFDATEAHKRVKPEMMEAFKQALADADREGQEVYSVIVVNGVPLMYSVRDRA